MKSLIYLLTFFTLNLNSEPYCDCFPLNSKTIKELKTKSDLIAIGKPIEKITSDYVYEEDVIVFEIDSLVKGKAEITTIMFNQNNAGNCGEYFELCKEYLITGDMIQNAKETYRMGQTNHSNKLERLIKENYMISTNGCRSFRLESSLAKEFLAHKN